MWRIDAVRNYQRFSLILLIIIIITILIIGSLLFSFFLNFSPYILLVNTLQISVIITSLMVLNLNLYVLVSQVINQRSDRNYKQQYSEWMKKWIVAYSIDNFPEDVPQIPVVANTYLEFTANMPANEKLITWANDFHLIDYWYDRLESRNKTRSLEAIEALGILGTPVDFPIIASYTTSKNLEVQIKSAITLARIIARKPANRDDAMLYTFSDTLMGMQLPVFVIENIYNILDFHSPLVKSYLLSKATLPDKLLLATINTIGSNYEVDYADTIGHYVRHESPIIRQSVLKAFENLNYIPGDVYRDVLEATIDDNKGVREQALYALKRAPLHRNRLPLWLALGDNNWRVRFEAAKILKQYGSDGEQILRTAAQKHNTPQGKAIAALVMENSESLLIQSEE